LAFSPARIVQSLAWSHSAEQADPQTPVHVLPSEHSRWQLVALQPSLSKPQAPSPQADASAGLSATARASGTCPGPSCASTWSSKRSSPWQALAIMKTKPKVHLPSK
jgi:hypothetical protein